jgi:aminoglycoside phosphotransferase (APT) family kinase protein
VELSSPALAAFVRGAAGADAASVERLERLGGGAIQESWALDLTIEGGPHAGRHELVLRTSSPSTVAVSWDRPEEFHIQRAAHRAGVTVAEPLWLCEAAASPVGKPFYLMRRVPGVGRGDQVVKDPAVRAKGEALAARLGAELARLHRLRPPVEGLGFIPVPEAAPALARVAEYRRHLDALGAREPVAEWALRWLELNAPPAFDVALVHADFRTGNYMVEGGELTAVLDWEFAGFSDPVEDLGWMLAPCWRFGAQDREAGGVGSREALLAGYEAEAGRRVPRELLPYWEIMATVRWAVIALQQAARHRSGAEPSLELALTAHVVPALELDLLTMIERAEAGREEVAA